VEYKTRKVNHEKIEIVDESDTIVALGLEIPGGKWMILLEQDFALAHSTTVVEGPFSKEEDVLPLFLRKISTGSGAAMS
jgi:hypothetical protein